MGNFSTFEYAAKAVNKQDHTQFLVYYNDETKQMEDTYILKEVMNQKWRYTGKNIKGRIILTVSVLRCKMTINTPKMSK